MATEDPDTLTSLSEARIKEVLMEGESPGLYDGLASIALDGTPIQDSGSDAIHDGVTTNNSPILNSATANFQPSDTNRGIVGDHIPANTTILQVLSATQVKMSANATASATGVVFALDGSLNFSNFSIYISPGTQDQSYIPGFDAEENSTAVGVRVKKLTPWTHRISDGDVNAARVDIRFPRMVKQNTTNGDTHGTSVQLKIELQSNNGGYVQVINDTINGKATSPYVRTYGITLTGEPPWDIRVTRLTEDSTSEALSNQTWVDSFTLVVFGKLRHPNTVVAGISIDAQQFGNIPVRAYQMWGSIIQVPTNYNPVTREYATSGPGTSNGIWDGTFKTAWTNNAAWCWYAMATNTRWGLGKFIDVTKVNIGGLYTAAKVCDEMVPDGYGGMEPRYTCTLYLQQAASAIQVLRDMASIFSAMVYYANGCLVPVTDSANPTVAHQFSPENIIGGKFNRSRASRTARHNYVTVMYQDQTNFGKPAYVRVEDRDDIRKRGIVPTNITALGASTPAAAWRAGKWLLLSEKLDQLNTWSSGQQGMHLRPGDIVETHDPYRSGKRWSGVVKAATTTTVTLDKTVELEDGKAYWISLLRVKTDGDDNKAGTVVRRAVLTAGPVTTDTLTFAAIDASELPDPRTVWILVASDLAPEKWKLIHVLPQDLTTVAFTALPYDATKFDDTDIDPNLDAVPTTSLPSPYKVKPPGAITDIEEIPVVLPSGTSRALEITWEPSRDQYLRGYSVSYRFENGNLITLNETPVASIQIPAEQSGYYDIFVVAVNFLGGKSTASTARHYVAEGNYLDSPHISGLELAGQGNDTVFQQRDAKFAWRLNSPSQFVDIGSEGTNGMRGAQQDPFFGGYRVSIIDIDTGLKIWPTEDSGLLSDPQFIFTEEMNAEANKPGKPKRAFRFRVEYLDVYNKITSRRELDVSNPVPPKQDLAIVPDFTSVNASTNVPAVADRTGMKIIRSLTSGFTPVTDGAYSAGVEEVYDGPDFSRTIQQPEANTYYYRMAIYDSFYSDVELGDLIWSDEVAGTTLTLTPTLPAPAISPGDKSFDTTFNVTLTIDAGQTARYTLDGSDVLPTSAEWPTSGGVYTTLAITSGCTLKVRGYLTDGTPTKQASATYTLVASGGGGSPACGSVHVSPSGKLNIGVSRTITLTCATPSPTIHVSINGGSYANYTTPFSLAVGAQATAYATASGFAQGPPTDFDNIDNRI